MSGRGELPASAGTIAPLAGGATEERGFPTDGSPAALVLVGHGSHRSARSARPVHDLARRLRRIGAFTEVRVAFWKEEPSLRHAFDLVESREVFVVPVFTSEGYFTDHVVPREMGIDGPVTHRQGRRIHYLRPVGTHARMAEVVRERAREVAPLSAEEAAAGTLVVVGHGTERHPRSAETTLAVVERLRRDCPFGVVEAAFLDQAPKVEDVLAELTCPDVIVVPFFISEGWHAGTTIPRDLALAGGPTRKGDTTIWYGLPVGTHASMVDVVRDLVADATAAAEPQDPVPERQELPARQAKRAFLAWIHDAVDEPRVFLDVQISRTPDGRFEIRHVSDRDRPHAELLTLDDPDDAPGVAGVTAEGHHRPLRTAPDLRTGWRFEGLAAEQVWETFTHLYPTAPVHRHLAANDALPITSFREAAGRQSGMYEGVGALSETALADLVDACCGERCLREPAWHGSGTAASGEVPCPEPCSLFISLARDELDRGA